MMLLFGVVSYKVRPPRLVSYAFLVSTGEFWENYCIMHSKLCKGAKSNKIVSSGPIIFAYLF